MDSKANRSPKNSKSGFTLVEVLISLVIIGVGLLVVANFLGRLTSNSADAKARSEAIHLAEHYMEQLRRDIDTDVPAQLDPNDLANHAGVLANYVVTWNKDVADASDPALSGVMDEVTVNVSWTDSRDDTQTLELRSFLARGGFAVVAEPPTPSLGGNPGPAKLRPPTGGSRLVIGKHDPAALPDNAVEPVGGPWENDPIRLILGANNVIEEIIDENTGDALEIDSGHRPARISGNVYFPGSWGGQDPLFKGIFASAFGLCPMSLPPGDAAGGTYNKRSYACFVAAATDSQSFGWRGNIAPLFDNQQPNDQVCVGAGGAAFTLSQDFQVRRYSGYECRNSSGTRVPCCVSSGLEAACCVDGGGVAAKCGDPGVVANPSAQVNADAQRGTDGNPILFPVGLKEEPLGVPLNYPNHHFLMGRGNNLDCAVEMASLDGSPFDVASVPSDLFCFTNDCPVATGAVLPVGCTAPGQSCDATGKDYHQLIYIGFFNGKFVFARATDQSTGTSWTTALCQGEGALAGRLPGLNQLREMLNLRIAGLQNNSWYWSGDQADTEYWSVRYRNNGGAVSERLDDPTANNRVRCIVEMDP